jgi:lysophospholipase L1-like esterase
MRGTFRSLTALCGVVLWLALASGAGAAEPIRVACVGDSITKGVGTTKGNAYPAQLGRMLGDKWLVQNFGVSGATLLKHGDKPYQKQAAFTNALAFHPDIVVIKLGTNDTKPANWGLKADFVADYKDLIRQFAELPSHPRFFLCHPAAVVGGGKWDINEAGVLAIIPLVDQVAAELKAGVVEIHAALKDHPEMVPDRVHPNTAGATVIATAVYRALTGKEYTGPPVLEPAPEKPSP